MNDIRAKLKGSAKKRQNKNKSTQPSGMVTYGGHPRAGRRTGRSGFLRVRPVWASVRLENNKRSPLPQTSKLNSSQREGSWESKN